MPTQPIKLFISYRSLDSAKVDTIVSRLTSLKQDDNTTPLYTVWQDKTGIKAAQDWWQAIVDAIIDCEVFVFCISQLALASDVCKAELHYATQRNRPIIPIVLEGEFTFTPLTGKNDIAYWDQIPATLHESRLQFLFYEGASFFSKLHAAIATFQEDSLRWKDVKQPRPIDPRTEIDAHNTSTAVYTAACDYADHLEFGTAEALFRKLINRSDSTFLVIAYEWLEILTQYQELIELDAHPATRFHLPAKWNEYIKLFPKHFIGGIFDPKGFGSRFTQKSGAAQTNREQSQWPQTAIAPVNPGTPSPIPALTPPIEAVSPAERSHMFNDVVKFLIPFVSTNSERQTLILTAFHNHPNIIGRINYQGAATEFATHIVHMLRLHGESMPGTQALWHLLVTLKKQIGANRHSEIDAFQPWANKEPDPPHVD